MQMSVHLSQFEINEQEISGTPSQVDANSIERIRSLTEGCFGPRVKMHSDVMDSKSVDDRILCNSYVAGSRTPEPNNSWRDAVQGMVLRNEAAQPSVCTRPREM